MAITGRVVNPRLSFRFLIEIDGLEAAYVETVQRPKDATTIVEHAQGGVNYTVKTVGGMETYEDLVLTKIQPAEEEDTWAYSWLQQSTNQITLETGIPSDYKRTVTVHVVNGANEPIETYQYEGCFVKEISYAEHDSMDRAAKMMETVTISVDRRIQ